jgi:hypothetical protein
MNDKLKGNNTVNHNIDLLYQFNLINYPPHLISKSFREWVLIGDV